MEQLKMCSKCKQELPRTAFNKQKQTADGLCGTCKLCWRDICAAYRKAHPEETRASNVAYREANREKLRAINASWAKANPEKIRACEARRYKANREKRLAKTAAYAKSNPEKMKAAWAAYAKANPEKIRARNAAFRKRNAENIKQKNFENRENLESTYIRHVLRRSMPLLGLIEIPPSLIEAKRLQLKVNRLIKEKSDEKNL